MRRVKHTLRGSTLAETLVVMLVTGIVFLAAMEALTLVSRLVARRAAVLVEAGRQRDGIFRLGQLLTTAQRAEPTPASVCTSIVQEARRH